VCVLSGCIAQSLWHIASSQCECLAPLCPAPGVTQAARRECSWAHDRATWVRPPQDGQELAPAGSVLAVLVCVGIRPAAPWLACLAPAPMPPTACGALTTADRHRAARVSLLSQLHLRRRHPLWAGCDGSVPSGQRPALHPEGPRGYACRKDELHAIPGTVVLVAGLPLYSSLPPIV